MTMGSSSLRIQSLQTAFDSIKIDKIQVRYATTISCGLRKPMRTRRPSDGVLSTEAIQAVQSLKLAARNPSKLHQVFDSKLSRLLKDDLLVAFAELQRQQHLELAVKVRRRFDFSGQTNYFQIQLSCLIKTFFNCNEFTALSSRLNSSIAVEVISIVRKEFRATTTGGNDDLEAEFTQIWCGILNALTSSSLTPCFPFSQRRVHTDLERKKL
ncbi:hypothetical protein L2E82_14073 [Cichorium intybus]|uniref:Uncharacterized protein n=1 Tax=Cichorium intybus TaxID=13427 RepID=A0ACB9EZS7_CICIN|nr:hypothetical protein L2E82_14073 [Cichorium intybus]